MEILWGIVGGMGLTVIVGLTTIHVLRSLDLLRSPAKDALLEERVRTLEAAVTQLTMVLGHQNSLDPLVAQGDSDGERELHEVSTEGLSR